MLRNHKVNDYSWCQLNWFTKYDLFIFYLDPFIMTISSIYYRDLSMFTFHYSETFRIRIYRRNSPWSYKNYIELEQHRFCEGKSTQRKNEAGKVDKKFKTRTLLFCVHRYISSSTKFMLIKRSMFEGMQLNNL